MGVVASFRYAWPVGMQRSFILFDLALFDVRICCLEAVSVHYINRRRPTRMNQRASCVLGAQFMPFG